LSLIKIFALLTIFSVLSLCPRLIWAQASSEHKHQNCSLHDHQKLQDIDDHYNEDPHDDCTHKEESLPDNHVSHDQHSQEKHDDHSNCDHEHASHNPELAASPHPLESCPDSVISMSAAEMKRFGIVVEKAATGDLEVTVKVRGEIAVNRDRIAHIVPRVSGIVQRIYRTLGDFVEKGGVMAIIESRELADTKTDYLNAVKHLESARTIFQREQKLRRKKVSSEQDHLTAKQAFAEAQITLRNCAQRLNILGFSKADLKQLPTEPATELSRFAVRSPFSGRIIKKDIFLGEMITDAKAIFVVADLTTVWVDLDLYQKDADNVKKGQKVVITLPSQRNLQDSLIDYVAPLVDEKTRTTRARVIINNQDEELRPGTFITAEISIKKIAAGVIVDQNILQDVGGQTCIFIQDEHGFEPRPVTLGETDSRRVEIIAGLSPGELVVTKNSFRLKAALETGIGSGCGTPGHVH
ncbi:MAG: efflux RND transporter periplasmic adaptor subunit, partial [Deltaproteobacteria bacterium]|nr:efflux RND transporter periplasmic adaptor subunit [Candidatus Tharpella sp.]